MLTRNPDRLNAAVRSMLQQCIASAHPVICFAEQLDRLRSDSTWSVDEIDEIEKAARHILKAVLER